MCLCMCCCHILCIYMKAEIRVCHYIENTSKHVICEISMLLTCTVIYCVCVNIYSKSEEGEETKVSKDKPPPGPKKETTPGE